MKLRYRLGTRIIYVIWRLLFGLKICGRENIPHNGGVIIAPNHLSNFDPPLVGTAVWFRECYYFAKKELFTISKFFSWILNKFNAYESTGKKALIYTRGLLKKQMAVVIFPEGTRSKGGDFLEFNQGVGWLASKYKIPVVPVLVKNTNTSLIKQLCRKSSVHIKFGTPITREEICNVPAGKNGRDIIVKKIRLRIDKLNESI